MSGKNTKRRLCACTACQPKGLLQTERTHNSHMRKHGHANNQALTQSTSPNKPLHSNNTEFGVQMSVNDAHTSLLPQASVLLIKKGYETDVHEDTILDQYESTYEGEPYQAPASPPLYFPSSSDDESADSDSNTSSHQDSDEEHNSWNPEGDPEYQPNDNIFTDDNDDNNNDMLVPPALSEHHALLNGYIHVFINAAYKCTTHLASNESLTLLHSTIKSCYPNGLPPDLDLDSMARTLRTVEKQLGVSTDTLITNYVLCPSCWKITKRVPFKVMPVTSLKMALARLLMHPGKWDELQHWQGEEDHDPGPPISCDEWYTTTDRNAPLNDIYDRWKWRSIPTGVARKWDPRRMKVNDYDVNNLHQRFISLKCGIIVHINIDCPTEPNTDQLNGLLEPFIQELEQLGEGEFFEVFDHEAREEVHVALPFAPMDTPAQLKTAGYLVLITPDSPIVMPRNNSNGSLFIEILTILTCGHLLLKTKESACRSLIIYQPGMAHKEQASSQKQLPWIAWQNSNSLSQYGGLVTPAAFKQSGGERPKADEWRNFMHVYPVALAVAWNMWSCPPDAEAPDPKKGSKVQQAVIKSKKLLHKWRIKNIAHDEDAQAEDYIELDDITAS
ncbi:hypothetical protein BDR05DRAFT_952144 [Suillus weaverae]|nr:hypothetical protein BDR05DRAFT_952144 [Suillus weaverae]